WSTTVGFARAARRGEVTVMARIDDQAGRAVEGARVRLETFHSARARRVLVATLGPAPGGGYRAALPLDRPGLWELRLRVERGDQVFTPAILQDLARDLVGTP